MTMETHLKSFKLHYMITILFLLVTADSHACSYYEDAKKACGTEEQSEELTSSEDSRITDAENASDQSCETCTAAKEKLEEAGDDCKNELDEIKPYAEALCKIAADTEQVSDSIDSLKDDGMGSAIANILQTAVTMVGMKMIMDSMNDQGQNSTTTTATAGEKRNPTAADRINNYGSPYAAGEHQEQDLIGDYGDDESTDQIKQLIAQGEVATIGHIICGWAAEGREDEAREQLQRLRRQDDLQYMLAVEHITGCLSASDISQ